MIVVDVGCACYGGDYSIERLVEEFHPHTLYAFDPAAEDGDERVGETLVIRRRAAAWTHAGEIGFTAAGLGGHIDPDGPLVRAIDLSALIFEVADSGDLVLKIDAEGAEYDLLEHLVATGADRLLSLAWVEWHQPDRGRTRLESELHCEVVEWRH